MIRRHQYYFALAAVCTGVVLHCCDIVMLKAARGCAERLKDVDAIKSDRIPTAFPGFAMHDDLGFETHSRHSDQYGGEFERTDDAGCAGPHRRRQCSHRPCRRSRRMRCLHPRPGGPASDPRGGGRSAALSPA